MKANRELRAKLRRFNQLPGFGGCMLFALMSERHLQCRNNLDFSPRLGQLLG
jgi:hypothetical protein